MSLDPSSLSRAVIAFVAASITVALACNEPKVANRCAGPEPRCMTRVVCAFDRERGCEVCSCEPAFPPTGQPTGVAMPPQAAPTAP
jgi:hypothetical protein